MSAYTKAAKYCDKPGSCSDSRLRELPLRARTCITMQTWCYDTDSEGHCGAYFAYVRRK